MSSKVSIAPLDVGRYSSNLNSNVNSAEHDVSEVFMNIKHDLIG